MFIKWIQEPTTDIFGTTNSAIKPVCPGFICDSDCSTYGPCRDRCVIFCHPRVY